MDLDVRTGPWRSAMVDIAAGLFAVVLLVAVTSHIPADAGTRSLDGVGVAVLVLAGGAMGLCRRWPVAAVAIVTGALAVYLLRDYPGGPIWVTGWVALGSLSWRRSRRAGFVGAAGFCGVLLVAAAVDGDLAPLLHLVFVGWSLAAVLVGDVLRVRRERMVQLEERARELEHTRDEEARRRVAEDRLRIARDLHDSVAHAMATINVQAGAAAHVVERRPEAAKAALTAIQRASGDVLDELAALLGLLRNADESAERAPTPGLESISALVETARGSGLSVGLAMADSVDGVPAPVGTAAYRIVQESLTNAIRHAPGSTVTVTVDRGDDGLIVEVVDDGDGPRPGTATASSTGLGISGMRERVAATGGQLDAGPRADRGFFVRATWGGAE